MLTRPAGPEAGIVSSLGPDRSGADRDRMPARSRWIAAGDHMMAMAMCAFTICSSAGGRS